MSDAPQPTSNAPQTNSNRNKGKGRAGSSAGANGSGGGSKRPRAPKKASSNNQSESTAESQVPQQQQRIRRDYEPPFEPSDEHCFICAEPVSIFALPPCNHRTCHVCSVRLRALYKKTACTFCNQDTAHLPIIFTRDPDKNYADFVPLLGLDKLKISEDGQSETADNKIQLLRGGKDDKLGIHFEDPELHQLTLALLAFNCPDPACKVVCKAWGDLKTHARQAHDRCMWYVAQVLSQF